MGDQEKFSYTDEMNRAVDALTDLRWLDEKDDYLNNRVGKGRFIETSKDLGVDNFRIIKALRIIDKLRRQQLQKTRRNRKK